MDHFTSLPPEFADSPGFLFIQTAKILRKAIDETLKPFDLQPHEYGLLKVVSVEGALPQYSFGERFDIDKASVTEIVDNLESRDLIYRFKSSTDGRVKMLNLTPKGSAVHTRATRSVNKMYRSFLEPVADEEWIQAKQVILKLLVGNHK